MISIDLVMPFATNAQLSASLLHNVQLLWSIETILNKVAETLVHPERLIGLLHNTLNGVRRVIPNLVLLLELLVKATEHKAENETADNGDTEHGGDDSVALAVTVLLEVPNV